MVIRKKKYYLKERQRHTKERVSERYMAEHKKGKTNQRKIEIGSTRKIQSERKTNRNDIVHNIRNAEYHNKIQGIRKIEYILIITKDIIRYKDKSS